MACYLAWHQTETDFQLGLGTGDAAVKTVTSEVLPWQALTLPGQAPSVDLFLGHNSPSVMTDCFGD